MQLTRFDRWLRERFVYQTLIYTMRPPSRLPRGVKRRKFQAVEGGRYHFLYLVKNNEAERELIFVLNAENQLFSTQVVERKTWYSKFIAPAEKSVTWWLISSFLLVVGVTAAGLYGNRLWQDPDTQKNLIEALDILKH